MSDTKDLESRTAKAQAWAFKIIKELPSKDRLDLELHLSVALIALWGAQWGTFGSDYALQFLQSQMAGVARSKASEDKETRQ